jgi:hypothetical protein
MKLTKIKESIDQKVGLNEKAAFLQEVAKFNEYGSIIYRTDSLREAAKAVSNIVENAERIALQETDDSFDDITVKRNMKSLKANNEQFMKTVNEVSKLQQRLESLYEEMGHTLSRYYEIH